MLLRAVVVTCSLLSVGVVVLGGPTASAAAPQRVFIIGDSLTFGSLPSQEPALLATGWSVVRTSAYGARSVRSKIAADPYTGLTAVDGLRGSYGDSPNWIIALGTNDSGLWAKTQFPAVIRQELDRIGPGHKVMWVNIYMPAEPARQDAWNAALEQVAAEHPEQLIIDDWAGYAAATHPSMTSDHAHYTGTGYVQRSKQVAAAASQLLISWARPTTSNPPEVVADGARGGFVASAPVRALDTRIDATGFVAGETRQIDLAPYQPTGSVAAAVNLTVTNTSAPGFLTAWPCDRPRPTTSNVNYVAHDTSSSAAIVRTAAGQLCVYSYAATDVVVDITGSFTPDGAGYQALAPSRLLDTRTDGAAVPAGSVQVVRLPMGATAAMLNITATEATSDGFVTAWPCDQAMPVTSSLNYRAGPGARANSAVVGTAADGTVCLYTMSATHLVVDLFGTFAADAPMQFQPVMPVRLLDTRDGTGGWIGMLDQAQRISIGMSGHAGQVAVGSLTAVGPRNDGFVSVWDGAGDAPVTSNVNFTWGQTTPNLATSSIGGDGTFTAVVGGRGTVDLLFDLTGLFVS